MQKFANPYQFQKIIKPIIPILAITTIITLIIALTQALIISPPDYQQKQTVRIMYIHVPAAYNAIIAYAIITIASAIFLINKHPLANIIANAAALPGITFTAICLITGSLWGKPIWGTFWEWDARMTSVLILFFIYLGYICLNQAFQNKQSAQKPAAILAIVGAINLPIIKFSVEWWHTLHQPASLIKLSGSAIDNSMLKPLITMMIAWQLWLVYLIIIRSKNKLIIQKIKRNQKNNARP